MLVATDFFTTEVWTVYGLVTYDALFLIHLATRKVHVAGLTPYPDQRWMTQIARNVTMVEWGFLLSGQYLMLDRDGKFCSAFQQTMEANSQGTLDDMQRAELEALVVQGQRVSVRKAQAAALLTGRGYPVTLEALSVTDDGALISPPYAALAGSFPMD